MKLFPVLSRQRVSFVMPNYLKKLYFEKKISRQQKFVKLFPVLSRQRVSFVMPNYLKKLYFEKKSADNKNS